MGNSSPMTWTKEKPTAPGWYWARHSMGRVEIIQVVESPPDDSSGQLFAVWWFAIAGGAVAIMRTVRARKP